MGLERHEALHDGPNSAMHIRMHGAPRLILQGNQRLMDLHRVMSCNDIQHGHDIGTFAGLRIGTDCLIAGSKEAGNPCILRTTQRPDGTHQRFVCRPYECCCRNLKLILDQQPLSDCMLPDDIRESSDCKRSQFGRIRQLVPERLKRGMQCACSVPDSLQSLGSHCSIAHDCAASWVLSGNATSVPQPMTPAAFSIRSTQASHSEINRGPEGRRSGRPPFFDRTGMSCRKIPARATVRQRFGHWPFLLVTFLWASKEKLPGRRRRTEALLLAETRKATQSRLWIQTELFSDPFSP